MSVLGVDIGMEWHLSTIGRLEQGSEMADCRNDSEGSQTIQNNSGCSGKYSFNKEYSSTLLRNFSKDRTRIVFKTN
jgi:hypothetical protein